MGLLTCCAKVLWSIATPPAGAEVVVVPLPTAVARVKSLEARARISASRDLSWNWGIEDAAKHGRALAPPRVPSQSPTTSKPGPAMEQVSATTATVERVWPVAASVEANARSASHNFHCAKRPREFLACRYSDIGNPSRQGEGHAMPPSVIRRPRPVVRLVARLA